MLVILLSRPTLKKTDKTLLLINAILRDAVDLASNELPRYIQIKVKDTPKTLMSKLAFIFKGRYSLPYHNLQHQI